MHPDSTTDNPEPIVGWLAIAAHLRVEKTTAQRWERHNGLPVHRLPGKRGGVYARAEELDGWRVGNEREHAAATAPGTVPANAPPDAAPDGGSPTAGTPTAEAAADAPEPAAPQLTAPQPAPAHIAQPEETGAPARPFDIAGGVLTLRLPLRWKWWAAGAVLGAALIWASMAWFQRTPPVAFRMEGATLVALNATGRELWRHSFPAALRPDDAQLGRNAWMGELTQGEPFRVLFPLAPAAGGSHAELYCLDPRGRGEWEFVPPAGFEIQAFRVFAARQREQSRIVVSSADPWGTADQVATVDGNGKVTGQYWHAGRLGYVAEANLDREDPVDVLLSGVDEAHRQATIVGFDRSGFDRRAMPKLVVLFPRSCVAEAVGPYNRACEMAWRGGVLRVVVREGPSQSAPPVVYEFDQGLKPLSVLLSGEYIERRRELEAAGRLSHSCEGEADRLPASVRVTWRGRLGE